VQQNFKAFLCENNKMLKFDVLQYIADFYQISKGDVKLGLMPANVQKTYQFRRVLKQLMLFFKTIYLFSVAYQVLLI